MLKDKTKILIGVVLLAVIVFAIVKFTNKSKTGSEYSVVYLSSGEVYIGKLTTFPFLKLKESYLLQVLKDEKNPGKNNFQLSPVKDGLWAPEYLHLVEKNVVFYGPLSAQSDIAKALVGQK